MSEDKSTESGEVIENIKESVEEVVEDVKESVEEVVEDIKETIEEVADTVESAIDDAKPPLMKLKDENPKLFYGAIAGIVVILGAVFMSGGDNAKQHVSKVTYTVGQSYTLHAANALTDTTLKILKVPGQMASFDNESDVVCNAPSGTPVIARSFQDAFGTKQLFVQVEVQQEAGDCRQGVKGWTLKTNLK
ncbi:hypothetical protein [methanotrophic endosymbiont of Bathymodiolus puteoserpentis (Logatchev)]|jgi:ElaB/YqjD/DUF883 family membrane-anchored ribosome-binding protein|uniref:hypothetical protein n=1 Tax=methanotrophic endosymbiont of Bathymodiolus puteoserpentis (Logatchev) TaxID=343235 RepID=UPI0008699B1B|nr:hypothetical protein [methanotrophic endosymbiont of Bathymodiolus puteoserpentis (Logatchev)]SCN47074.1 hypothetical protein BAZMOX_89081_0 [methanotrophic endosymbiont of Bathymodiolus azoricus (Menez Gwen)]SHE21895.1 hypothetical protein BPUTEOMOX_1646 [methanotrophic endosymbiont of Bathymodiolus puteoserpentis (Logatchev)]